MNQTSLKQKFYDLSYVIKLCSYPRVYTNDKVNYTELSKVVICTIT